MSQRFLAILFLGLALRLGYVGAINPPAVQEGSGVAQSELELYRYLDGDGYLTYTQAFHNGEFLTSKDYLRRMPLYPALLAFYSKYLLLHTTVPHFWQVKILQSWQALLDLLTLSCVYLAVRKVWNEPAALWAALAYAVYPLAIYRLVMMNTEVIQAASLALFVLGALCFLKVPTPRHAFAASILTSLILYISPAFQFFPLFFTASFFFLLPRSQALKLSAIYLLPILCLVLLWGVRNYQATGQFYLFDVRGGKEFWLGNHTATNGEWEGPYRDQWEEIVHAVERDIAAQGGAKNDENRHFYKMAMAEITGNPTGVAVLWFKKFFRFWFIPERKNMLWVTIPMQSFYLLLALAGFYFTKGRNFGANLFFGVILYFCAVYTASYACIRFSHPIMPWVCALGGIGMASILPYFRRSEP